MKFLYSEHSLDSGIYKIVNTHTNRVYIGQAKRFKERWCGHRCSLVRGRHQNRFLQADFDKCRELLGHDDFLEFWVIEVLPNSSKEERSAREEHWISHWFDGGKQCYNLTTRAISRDGSVSKNPEETRRKKSEIQKALWANCEYRDKMLLTIRRGPDSPFWRRKHSPEAIEKIKGARAKQVFSADTIAKIAASNRGRKHTDEAKQKIAGKNSENMKRLWQDPTYRERAKHRKTSQEARAKQSESHRKRLSSPEARERMRKISKELWADPAFREKVAAGRKKAKG